jgi:AmmeMemoRadiSam system protein B
VAGRFYPAAADELTAVLDALLDAVPTSAPTPVPVAIVAPHAGYVYSGPIAASAYARVAMWRERIHTVAVLGPSHFVALDGLAVPTVSRLETPLGPVRVGTDMCRSLVDMQLVSYTDAPHAREHSMEVQLPFLRRILGDNLTCVPVAVGASEPNAVADVLDALDADLVVVSTDLSHYLDQARARRQDDRTAAAVVARRPEQIGDWDACGAWALRGLLVSALRHDHRVEQVDLRTSGDTAGDRSRVVGYGAFVLTAAQG